MELNSGLREMMTVLRATKPEMGLKNFTKLVNSCLPSDMQVEKFIVRDFIRGLEAIQNQGTVANEAAANDAPANTTTENIATQQVTAPSVALKPRDETFEEATKQFFVAFQAWEREYLLGLDSEMNEKVRTGADGKLIDSSTTFPLAHLRHHVEVLLTLKGVNPSAVLCKSHHDDSLTNVITGVVLKCLVPLLDAFAIESYGFRLRYLPADVLTAGPRARARKGNWVLADTLSPKWPLVRDLFFKDDRPAGRRVPARLVAAALGYPVDLRGGRAKCEVKLYDDTEERILKGMVEEKVCCVEALHFPCGPGDVAEWQVIWSYFKKCRAAAAEVGTAIGINLCEHMPMALWVKSLKEVQSARGVQAITAHGVESQEH